MTVFAISVLFNNPITQLELRVNDKNLNAQIKFAGLSLGTGLVIFASSLSETLMEILQYHKEPPSGPVYDYRYGWCFFTAGFAFIITNMAAVLSITGYLNRFASVDEMVSTSLYFEFVNAMYNFVRLGIFSGNSLGAIRHEQTNLFARNYVG